MAKTTLIIPDFVQTAVEKTGLPWEAGKTAVSVDGLLSDADLADATKNLTIQLLVSFDNGITYQSAQKQDWVGGVINPTTTPPSPVAPNVGAGYSQSMALPTHVGVRLEAPSLISAGASVTF